MVLNEEILSSRRQLTGVENRVMPHETFKGGECLRFDLHDYMGYFLK